MLFQSSGNLEDYKSHFTKKKLNDQLTSRRSAESYINEYNTKPDTKRN